MAGLGLCVDTSGVTKVNLKGDHGTIHTKDSAFRKACTMVTMGPIFGFDRISAYAETVSKNPAGASSVLFSLPDIIALPAGSRSSAAMRSGSASAERQMAIGTRPVRKKARAKIAARVKYGSLKSPQDSDAASRDYLFNQDLSVARILVTQGLIPKPMRPKLHHWQARQN